MSDTEDDLKAKLNSYKPKKKKLDVPKEFLEGAINYEEKLTAVKIFADKNTKNTVRLFKELLKDAVEDRERNDGKRK